MAANQHDNRPQQSNVALGLRALVLLYVLYLAYGIVAAYVRGDSDALSLPLTIAAAGILGVASVVMLVLTYRQWRSQSSEAELPEEDGADESTDDTGDAL
ncbi:MAG: hypothetical protein ACI3U8_04915 [Candidatus Onthomonas sp.]